MMYSVYISFGIVLVKPPCNLNKNDSVLRQYTSYHIYKNYIPTIPFDYVLMVYKLVNYFYIIIMIYKRVIALVTQSIDC